MNSYLLKGGGLLKSPVSPATISDDFTLIHEVDTFIAQFQDHPAKKLSDNLLLVGGNDYSTNTGGN
jgi:hypothetical protein